MDVKPSSSQEASLYANDETPNLISIDPNVSGHVMAAFSLKSGKLHFMGKRLNAQLRWIKGLASKAQGRLDMALDDFAPIKEYRQVIERLENWVIAMVAEGEDRADVLVGCAMLDSAKKMYQEVRSRWRLNASQEDIRTERKQFHHWQGLVEKKKKKLQNIMAIHLANLTKNERQTIVLLPQLNAGNKMVQSDGLSSRGKENLGLLAFSRMLPKIEKRLRWKGGTLISPTEAFSTGTCSHCGHWNHPGHSRIFQCSNRACKARLDRDENAARNIFVVSLGLYADF